MKYIISESRLNDAITHFFDQYIKLEELNYYHPVEETEDGEEFEDTNRAIFYFGDNVDDGEEILRYYECEYFSEDAIEVRKKCPIVSLSRNLRETFDELFGDYWVEPFKQWINLNLDLNAKTVNYL